MKEKGYDWINNPLLWAFSFILIDWFFIFGILRNEWLGDYLRTTSGTFPFPSVFEKSAWGLWIKIHAPAISVFNPIYINLQNPYLHYPSEFGYSVFLLLCSTQSLVIGYVSGRIVRLISVCRERRNLSTDRKIDWKWVSGRVLKGTWHILLAYFALGIIDLAVREWINTESWTMKQRMVIFLQTDLVPARDAAQACWKKHRRIVIGCEGMKSFSGSSSKYSTRFVSEHGDLVNIDYATQVTVVLSPRIENDELVWDCKTNVTELHPSAQCAPLNEIQ